MFLLILHANIGDESAHTINIVGQNDTTDCLYEDHQTSFLIACRNNVSKANRKHNGCAPIIRPNVLLIPFRILYAFINQPIFLFVHIRNTKQHNWKKMGIEKVE